MRNLKNDDAGYTLTEMLVVILIIALIAAVLTPSILGQLNRARAKTVQVEIETTASALQLFKSDVGRLPTEAEGLAALVKAPAGADNWLGPYIKSDKALLDPWGRPLVYSVTSDGVATVKSLGADGKTGGTGVDQDVESTAR